MTNREEALDNLIDLAHHVSEFSNPDETLRMVHAFRSNIDDIERAAVEQARFTGASWEEIGGMLGVSRQAAWERFS